MITTVLATVFILGVLIFIHELGHFLAAKRVGIRVERFSIGYPPKMVGKKIGDTEYCISWIPFGGYVKMAGENPEEITGKPWEFHSKPVRHRMAVVSAGPLMNILLAFLIFWFVVATQGIGTPGSAKIGRLEPKSPLFQAGLEVGDEILKIDGRGVVDLEEAYEELVSSAHRRFWVSVLRQGEVKQFQVLPVEDDAETVPWFSPWVEPKVGQVKPESPAEKAGLMPGDVIVSIDGRPIDQWDQMADIIHSSAEQPVIVQWRRGAEKHQALVTPDLESIVDEEGKTKEVGLIGITPHWEMSRVGILAAARYGFLWMVEIVFETARFIKRLVLGQISPKLIGGPVFIARLAGQTARAGLMNLVTLMALISINLGLINVIPIPALDGGHLLFLAIEGVRRKPLSLKQRLLFQQIGIVLIIALMIFVTINDISKLIR